MVDRIVPAVPSIMYMFGGKVSPSWSPHPTRKSLPGPCTTLVGMQFGMGKVFSTKGPFGLPRFGLMTSTVPPNPAIDVAPPQFEVGAVWLQKTPVFLSITGP